MAGFDRDLQLIVRPRAIVNCATSQAPEMASALGLDCLGLCCQGIVADAEEATTKSVSTTIITDVLKRILLFSFGCMFEWYTGGAFTRNYESFTRIAA